MVLPELSMTTGAPLPIDTDTLENIMSVLEDGAQGLGQVDYDGLTHRKQAVLSSIIIRRALAGGASSRVSMLEPRRPSGMSRREHPTTQRPS